MNLKYLGFASRWSPLAVRERALPSVLKPNELLVNVSFIGLNPIDIKLKSIALPPLSWQVGKDFSGVVEAVGGAQTSAFKIGDRVCGGLLSPLDGVLGTHAILDVTKHAVMQTPPALSDEQAAAFPLTFGTAWELLSRTPKRGRLLVLGGASNVGTYAIQIAKHHYDYSEIVATCSASSADFVKSVGADRTIDYRQGNVSQQLKDLGIKFDAIVDTVGGYDALKVWPDILKSYRDGGVYVSNAGDVAPSGSYKHALVAPTLKTIPWALPRLLFGRFLGINYQLVAVGTNAWVQPARDFIANNKITMPIDSVYPLSEYQQAWDRLENMQAKGKVLLDVRNA